MDQQSNESSFDEESNKGGCSVYRFMFVTLIIISFLLSIALTVIVYFTFAGLTSLTIYLFLYEWLSLLTKETYDMIVSIFTNLSDFGLIFTLALYCIYIIKDYASIMISSVKYSLQMGKGIYNGVDTSEMGCGGNCCIFIILFIICLIFLALACFFGYVIYKWLFWAAVIYECIILVSILIGTIYFKIVKRKYLDPLLKDQVKNDTPGEEEDEETLPTEVKDVKEGITGYATLMNDNIFFISQLDGMFDKTIKPVRCVNHQTAYRVVISILIVLLQLYSILWPFLVLKTIDYKQFIIFLVCKSVYLIKILSYNFFDLVFNGKRTYQTIKQEKGKIVFWVVIVLYFVVFLGFFAILILSKFTVFPTIDNALFKENNNVWNKFDNRTIIPEGFCLAMSQVDGSLKTEDFAMLTTLPRLYGTTEDGRCFIKPSMRGLFNTTMKYIFGKDYESDGIYILCKKVAHYPYLVISSERILSNTISLFKETEITMLGSQFEDIKNRDYFENFRASDLRDKEGKKLLNNYQNCVSSKSSEDCEEEWDEFTQYYWPKMHSNNYEDIIGFERYQINIDENTVIQPSFVRNDKLWHGTHYIIGGSYEDSYSIGIFIETLGRKYIPDILENFLPLYSFVKKIANHIFLQIDWFNKYLFYFEVSSSKEMESVASLYSQFNFTHEALYTVGHSISGTVFKGLSFFNDIQGIAFEASDGENNMIFMKKNKLNKKGDSDSQTTNVYSDGTIFTGNDDNCNVNGVLPKRYILPSVYDTACLTAITCSETQRYVNFCKQVLTQNKKDPLKEYNKTFDAYLDFYGYN